MRTNRLYYVLVICTIPVIVEQFCDEDVEPKQTRIATREVLHQYACKQRADLRRNSVYYWDGYVVPWWTVQIEWGNAGITQS